jgi:hypothetical protein
LSWDDERDNRAKDPASPTVVAGKGLTA